MYGTLADKIPTKWAPTIVISRVITPLIGVITYNPSYPFIRPFIGVTTLFITGRGTLCTNGGFFSPHAEFKKQSAKKVKKKTASKKHNV